MATGSVNNLKKLHRRKINRSAAMLMEVRIKPAVYTGLVRTKEEMKPLLAKAKANRDIPMNLTYCYIQH